MNDADIRISDVGEAGELRRYARQLLEPIVRNPRSGIEGLSLSVNRSSGDVPEEVCCQILVRLSSRLSLSVEKSEGSAHAAIGAAAERLGWALGLWHGLGLS